MTNFSVKVVIFVLVFGSAVSDYERNIKEFCSKKYFDTIVTKPVGIHSSIRTQIVGLWKRGSLSNQSILRTNGMFD